MKNTKNRILCLALAAILVLAVGIAVAAASSDGMTFTANDRYTTETSLNAEPLTFMATVSVPGTGGWPGSIFGNWASKTAAENGVNFDLGWHKSYGSYPRIVYGADQRISFSEIDIRKYASDGKYATVSITIQRGAGTNGSDKAVCNVYVDGALKATSTKDGLTIGSLVSPNSYILGGDNQMTDGAYIRSFLGGIKNVKVYSDIRTDAELAADAKAFSADSSDKNLLAAYDLTASDPFADLSSYGNNIIDLGAFKYNFTADTVYVMDKELAAEPHTFAARVYVPRATDKGGAIFSNYVGEGVEFISFEVTADGAPVLRASTENGSVADMLFNEVDVRGTMAEIVIVHTDTLAKCYINGELKQTVTGEFAYHADACSEANVAISGRPYVDPNSQFFVIGGDSSAGNNNYFKGMIASVALYSEPLSAREIKAMREHRADADIESAISYYDLSDYWEGFMKDLTGNGYNLSTGLYQRRPDAKPEYAYSFAILGDTQRQSRFDYEASTEGNIVTKNMAKYYDWLVANKDEKNIKYVIGLGDITEYDYDLEWQIAKSQITKLDGAGIPYSLIAGNHDSVGKLNQYFAPEGDDFYTSRVTGYYEEGSLGNYYINFEVGETKYMIINFVFGPDDDVLKWANEVVAANPDRRVIVTTHAYMNIDGTTLDAGDYAPPRGEGVNNGEEIWNEFVSLHRNILMVFSGHIGSSDVVMTQAKGVHGNTVSQFLVDPQSQNVNLALICMLYFSEDGREVSVEWISAGRTLEAQAADANAQDVLFRANSKFDLTLISDEGNGIYKTEYIGSDGLVDTYRIYYTNGTYQDFTVTNGAQGEQGVQGEKGEQGEKGDKGDPGIDGAPGKDGIDGAPGKDGIDGKTPYIGENGNWWIGITDTGVSASGGAVTEPDYGNEIISGTCGATLDWWITDKNILVISGDGAMTNYRDGESPWISYAESITGVVVKEGVTAIGKNAFSGLTKLNSVKLPVSLVAIEGYAFYGCSALDTVIVPANVRFIGAYAFRRSGISALVLRAPEAWSIKGLSETPDNMELAGIAATYAKKDYYTYDWYVADVAVGDVIVSGACGNNVYWSLTSDGTLTVFGEGKMDDYRSTTMPWHNYIGSIFAVVIEDGVTNIGKNAFANATRLYSVTIPEGVTYIGAYAFYGSAIENITVPATVKGIGAMAFVKCPLKNVAFGNTEGWIAGGASILSSQLLDPDTAAECVAINARVEWKIEEE